MKKTTNNATLASTIVIIALILLVIAMNACKLDWSDTSNDKMLSKRIPNNQTLVFSPEDTKYYMTLYKAGWTDGADAIVKQMLECKPLDSASAFKADSIAFRNRFMKK